MNSDLASQVSTTDAVIKLQCPECSGGLNLRRKHLGISGKCVHCKTAITAVEEAGVVSLKRSSEIQPTASQPAPAPAPAPAPVEDKAPAPEPTSSPDEEATRFVPPPLSEPQAEVALEKEKASDVPTSTWGFPTRNEQEDELAAAALDSIEEAPVQGEAAPTSFAELTGAAPDALTATPQSEDKEGQDQSSLPTGFGFSTPEGVEAKPPVADENQPEAEASVAVDPDDLFESKDESPGSALFSNQSGTLNESWGAKVPNQNHASISPFSTGSAEPDPGFAETLFREKAEGDTGKIQPKSPFGEMDGNDDGSMQGGALFSQTPAARPPKPEEEKEVILDGDGRPLREMTPEEKEQFAQDIMHFGDYNKRSPWLKRIVRFVATIAVLSGIGYAAYVFMPQDQVEVAKAKVLDWLEPGSVLMQYLPFEVGESENGEKEVKIKALEGLDNLSTQMDQYLTTAEDQLNETLPEGAEGYEREKPIDMPEMPKIPNIPGLNIPGLPVAGSDSVPETADPADPAE